MVIVGLLGGAASVVAGAQAAVLVVGKIVLSIRSSFSVDTELVSFIYNRRQARRVI